MRDLSATKLESAQQASSLEPAIKIVLTSGETSYTLEEDRLLNINHIQEPDHINAKDTLFNNSDGYFTDKDLQGYQAVVYWGLVTKDGKEYSTTSPMWITWQQLDSKPGKLTCELTMLGIPDLMDQDEASESYIPAEADTKKVKTLLTAVAGATLAPYTHCTAYEVVYDSEDGLIDSYMPKDSFRIYVGGSRWAAFKRLLEYTGCVARVENDGKIHVLVPTTTGTDYDYEYSLESGHTFFSKAYRKSLVLPNYIVVQSQPDDDPSYSGSANDADSYALLPKRKYYQCRLQSNDEATSIAAAILGRVQLNSEIGAADTPMNCGAELYDYVKVTDETENDYRVGNIGSISRKYKPGQYTMRFSFGDPPIVRHIKEMYQDIKNQAVSEGEDFERLYAKNAYIEHLSIDEIDAVWLDPDSNIDLSEIGDTLDNLPDGETYAKILSMHLDAGVLQLNEDVFYKAGYDPSVKRRTFTAEPTTPYDLGDLWLDDTVTKRCTTARATGDYQAGDWTEVSIDEIADGVTYRRTKSSSLTADGLIILDELYIDSEEGTYALIERTDLSAGHLLLSSVVQSEEYRTVTDDEKDAWASGITDALAAAATAQETADGKIITFFQDEPPTAEGVGDIWFDTDDKNKAYRWSGSEWVDARDSDIAQAISNASDAQSTADGKVTTFFQTSAPEAEGVGDLWVDTDDNNKLYRWTGAEWSEVEWNLDNIGEGSNYQKILATDISSGHIKLTSSTVIDGEWYDESGVEIDASHGINIYGTNQALTTRATKAGTIQCYVGADGKIYAGGGNIRLDHSGLEVIGASGYLIFRYSEGATSSSIFNDASNNLELSPGGDYVKVYTGKVFIADEIQTAEIIATDSEIDTIHNKVLIPENTDDFADGEIELGENGDDCYLNPSAIGCGLLGSSTKYWWAVFSEYVYYKNIGSFQEHDDVALVKAMKSLKMKDSHGEERDIIDPTSLPAEVKSEELIDAGAIQGLTLGALKALIEKNEALIERVKALEAKAGI